MHTKEKHNKKQKRGKTSNSKIKTTNDKYDNMNNHMKRATNEDHAKRTIRMRIRRSREQKKPEYTNTYYDQDILEKRTL